MNAILSTVDKTHSSVIDGTHSPILKTLAAKADNGILKEGLIVALDGDGLVDAYDPDDLATLADPVGVLVNELDTAKDNAAVVVKHGTVVKAKLLVGSAAPDAADIAALEALTIFPV